MRYGTTGVGTGAQLAAALLFKTLTNVESQAVPFDGGAPALTALLGNQIDVASLQVGEGIENIKSGKLLPLSGLWPSSVSTTFPTCRPPRSRGSTSRSRSTGS